MKIFLIILALLISPLFSQGEGLLPDWNDNELREGWISGESLLGLDHLVEEPDFLGDIPQDEKSRLSISQGLLITANQEVPKRFIDRYFGKKSTTQLIDPQLLLGKDGGGKVTSALRRHQDDSDVDLLIYVFAKNQKLPVDIRTQGIIESLHAEGKPVIVSLYYLGLPQRTEIYLNSAITKAVSLPESQRALQSSVIHALGFQDPAKQLEAYVEQLSIRAYWMERLMAEQKQDSQAVGISMQAADETSNHEAHLDELNFQKTLIYRWLWAFVLLAVLILLIFSAWVWVRKKMRYTVSDSRELPRLGAPRGAGFSGVISFAVDAPTPAEQRLKTRDHSGDL